MLHNLMDYVCSYDNLWKAYREAEKSKRYRTEVSLFKQDLEKNLFDIQRDLKAGTYQVGAYREFYVRYPKPRLVMALGFRDRVVQWAIYRQLNPYLDKRFISDSFACRKGKGALEAVQRVLHWEQEISRKPDGQEWYCLKIDIAKYFYRVSHEKALDMFRSITDDERFISLMDTIINNAEVPFGLPEGVSADDCPPEQRLYDVGMPIGNLSSQMIANMYLDRLDQFCKKQLRIHYYARYMDDVVIFYNDLATLHRWRDQIEIMVRDELSLRLNKKTSIQKMMRGIEFVGRIILPSGVRFRKSSRGRIKRVFKREAERYQQGFSDLNHIQSTIASYYGQMLHASTYNLKRWIYLNIVFCRSEPDPESRSIAIARLKEQGDMQCPDEGRQKPIENILQNSPKP